MKTLNYKTWLTGICMMIALSGGAQSYGEIRGIIKDNDNLEPIPFATVKILQGNLLVGGTQSNEQGRYSYKPLNPGSYELMIISTGFATQPVNKVRVNPNEATYVDVKLSVNTLTEVVVVAKAIDYTRSGVDKSMYVMKSLDAKELMQNASYNRGDIKGALPAIMSDAIEGPGGAVHIRGARDGASGYFIDGVRTLGESSVPGLCIENLTVLSGGVPAMYGDVTSGVVIITTKSYFSGIRDKNIRIAEYQEKRKEEKARQKAKEDEEKRAKEIEDEKRDEGTEGIQD